MPHFYCMVIGQRFFLLLVYYYPEFSFSDFLTEIYVLYRIGVSSENDFCKDGLLTAVFGFSATYFGSGSGCSALSCLK